jgi:cardiolipin synthase C
VPADRILQAKHLQQKALKSPALAGLQTHRWATVLCIMQASPPRSATSEVTSSRAARHSVAWLTALVFPVILAGWVSGCASLPKDVERPVSTALTNPGETRLGQAVAARAAKASARSDSGFALVSSAELAFTSRMTLIKAAQKTLDIQYYAIFADDTTERMFDALREAAARGVRIRILLDDFNTSGKNAQVLKLAFEKNMEMRLFNPLPGGRGSLFFRILGNLNDVEGMQRRMHNKIFVADNAVAITGGRNLGETYFGQSAGTNFIDIDLLAAGRVARDLSRSFDQYWNNPLAYPVQSLMSVKEIEAIKAPAPVRPGNAPVDAATDANAGAAASDAKASLEPGFPGLTDDVVAPSTAPKPPNPTTAARTVTSPTGVTTTLPALPDDTDLRRLTWTWAPSVMLADKPSKIEADVDSVEEAQDTTVDGLLGLMEQAKKDVLIVSPYFVPGPRMMKQLESIRQRGVRVRVLTNSLASNDAPAAHVGYARYREALLKTGIELYEMRAEQPGTVRSLGSVGGSLGNLGSGSLGSGGGSRASLHAKVVVIDDRLLVVGSMNLDLRSQLQNSEVAIVVRNRSISAEATRLIEPALTNGAYHVELDGGRLVWRAPQNSGLKDTPIEPDASTALKLLLKVIWPLAPDEML